MIPREMMCGVKKIPMGEYRGYTITKLIQTDLETGEPLNNECEWYSLYNPVFNDRIGTGHEWKIKHTIDYRIQANPHTFGVI